MQQPDVGTIMHPHNMKFSNCIMSMEQDDVCNAMKGSHA
jgi:hypothetical protein